jgi:hypothetical protein
MKKIIMLFVAYECKGISYWAIFLEEINYNYKNK